MVKMPEKKVHEYNMHDKKKSKHPDVLPVKFFTARNSLLTDMMQNIHFKVIYRMGLAVILSIIVNNIITYLKFGKVNIGQRLYVGFDKLHLALFVWCFQFLISLLTYFGFNIWKTLRNEIPVKEGRRKNYDYGWILMVAFYYFSFILYVPSYAVLQLDLAPITSVIVVCEQLRFLMKCHAFLRSNVPLVINNANNESLPSLKQFLYFLFAPTLVYQNKYPRTNCIRWKFVFTCLAEIAGCIFLLGIIFDKIISNVDKVCIEQLNWLDISETIFTYALYGTAIAFLGNYLLLHCWLNVFAELLRFSDRLFYKDWWTSTSYPRYYRTWNVVVHDWLYTYIYKDFYEILFPKNKFAAKLMVTLLSALFHEYFIMLSLRFFLPVLFFQFFILGSFVSLIKESGGTIANIILLYTYGLGITWQIVIYSLEYIAKDTFQNNAISLSVPTFMQNQCVR